MATHYDTLGIPREATGERLKRSYRKLVKIYHPDRCPSGSEAHAEAEKKIREINIAYGVLSKPLNRAKYDAKLNKRPTPYSEAEPEHCAWCGKPTGYLGYSKASGALPRMYWNNPVKNIALPGIHALAKEPKGAPSIPCQNARTGKGFPHSHQQFRGIRIGVLSI